MNHSITRRSKTPGLPPGTLIHVGEKRTEKVRITLIDYDEKSFIEREVERVDACLPFRDTPTVTWINVEGLHEVEVIESMGTLFGLHPLLLEDILHTNQRPKLDDHGNYLALFLRMLTLDRTQGGSAILTEQVCLIAGPNYVITFQERPGDVFDPVRERLRRGKGKIRGMGADYLAYALLDAMVDGYFMILEDFGDRMDEIEEELLSDPTMATLHRIHRLKREGLVLRRSIWPLREVVSTLERGDNSIIREGTKIYLRDVYDHTIQVIENVETFRDTMGGMVDLYLSTISNRMNEVMKVLTIIATIFIPLTFIAGIYGMNFANMPELEWRYGYFITWGVIAAIALTMVVFFRKRKWL